MNTSEKMQTFARLKQERSLLASRTVGAIESSMHGKPCNVVVWFVNHGVVPEDRYGLTAKSFREAMDMIDGTATSHFVVIDGVEAEFV